MFIKFSSEESIFNEINENFARGKGSIIESITIDSVVPNKNYKEKRNAFNVKEDELEKLTTLLKFLANEDYESTQ